MASSEPSLKRSDVYNLSGKRFLFAGINEIQVRYAFEAFNLDPLEWGAIHWGAALHGRGFEKIAVMQPYGPLTDKQERWYQHLKCRLINPESQIYLL